MTAPPVKPFGAAGEVPLQRRERRPVTLSAEGTREDGSVVDLTITDLSYDGCGALCAADLVPGDRLSLSVMRRGATGTVVRWAERGRVGLAFASEEPVAKDAFKPRRYERVSVDGEAGMRRSGKTPFRVHIYDICPDGCKAEFVERPELKEQLWIKFDGIEALGADVCWIVGSKAGLRFERPIHSAVFDMLLARLHGGVPR